MPRADEHRRPVTATYRLQFSRAFTFADAEAIVPYCVGLGVSHLYASPIFCARPGSTHGYDVVDPTRVNPELGGMEGFERLAGAARQAGLGLILDIVPNHMAADRRNPTWMETLCLGPDAPSAPVYDLDWSRSQIALPVLGGPLEETLEAGEIAIACDPGGWLVAAFHDHAAPLRPRTVASVLEAGADHLPRSAGAVAMRWRALERNGDAAAIEDARAALLDLAREAGGALGQALALAKPREVLFAQHWRLEPWQSAAKELTHRRFFNIVELVGVRVEDKAVFDLVHRLPLALLHEGMVDGLRVDHVDGLADPAGYCEALRAAAGPGALIVVEKILEGEEALRLWPVDGTTGYERLNEINGLFVDPGGHAALDAHLVARGLLSGTPKERLARAKRQVVEEMFASEVARLSGLAAKALEGTTPVDAATLRQAVVALAVHCPVYRSYVTTAGHDGADEAVWRTALSDLAGAENESVGSAAARLVELVLADKATAFAIALQQLTGPAMAKGLEDTEFYRSAGLLCVNEVGADPAAPSVSLDRFHDRQRAARHRDLVPLATHDTKRSADARTRLAVISADAPAFIERAARFDEASLRFARDGEGGHAPDALDRWIILQTLVAAWPISADRMEAFSSRPCARPSAARGGRRRTWPMRTPPSPMRGRSSTTTRPRPCARSWRA